MIPTSAVTELPCGVDFVEPGRDSTSTTPMLYSSQMIPFSQDEGQGDHYFVKILSKPNSNKVEDGPAALRKRAAFVVTKEAKLVRLRIVVSNN